ncbi:hypothetical protein FPV58_12240 [Mycolicibacterium porcinum]|uniref:Rv0361 family membrane protein n=1 Tax=Mycolicibacterium porcinum TaxID=39693 RepID=UPI00119273CF|nr:hypothetical protein [Mycolicibacterium porcinum]TVY02731.1 hypothetical protein FPV58_12240 [Mycolicibacterium porcinum]
MTQPPFPYGPPQPQVPPQRFGAWPQPPAPIQPPAFPAAPVPPPGWPMPPHAQWGPPQPPPPRRRGLLIAIPIVVVGLVAAGGLGAFFLIRKSNADKITNLTYSFADAINRDDVDAAATLMCTERASVFRATAGATDAPSTTEPEDPGFTVTGVTVDGDHATSTLTFDKTGKTGQLEFRKENGDWKVCGE